MLKSCQLDACPSGTLGLHLSRAPWDPYPWVSGVQDGSSAQRAGVQNGDTVLELNGRDVLGQKIAQIAEYIGEHWKSGATHVTVVVWRNQPAAATTNSDDDDEEQRLENEARNKQQRQQQQQQQQQSINQLSLQKFATCLQHIAQLLECPVCLEVIRPPGWQCCNGHVVCNDCRSRSVKCPVCRVPLGPRGRCLLADKLFTLLAESFPCEGVKNNNKNKNSSCNANNENSNNASLADTTKCSRVFQNRPKMAAALFKDKALAKPKKQESRNQIKCGDETPSRREAARQIDGSPSAGEGVEAGVVAPCASNVTRSCLRNTAATRRVHSLNEKEVLKSLPADTTTGEREETSLSSTNVNAIIISTPASSNKSNNSNDNKSQPSPTSLNFGSSSRLRKGTFPGNGKAELVDIPGASSWQRVSPETAAGMRATTATTTTMTMTMS